MKAIYTVIQSENGKIVKTKKFMNFNNARNFYCKCEGGVIFACKKGEYESVFYKGLNEDSVCALMGWENNNQMVNIN